MKRTPFLTVYTANPKANYLAHKKEISAIIEETLDEGMYVLGKQVSAFENELITSMV